MDYVSNLEETRLQWLENFGRRYFWLLALVVMALVALVVLRSFRLADDSMGGEYAQYALMGLIASLVGLNTHVLRIFSGGNKRSRKDKAPPSRSSSDEKEGESE
ncbi:hypothetical protein D3093_15350 (plasmid) [Azospirillum argentinense]|uniref:Uncharacterized protein n=2 Tax=Azospirillum argentinense TaxID=2970906 RepID=A0A4D8PDT2_9PROT|nr:hypothetical protein D3093_15350 [Azospirillum argentinense]